MKLMVGGILTVTAIALIVVFSMHINSADKCKVVVTGNDKGTVYNAEIRFGGELWGEMDENEKATILHKCTQKVEKQHPAKQYIIYAKNQKTGELVFTNDSEKGMVEIGKYATEIGKEAEREKKQ